MPPQETPINRANLQAGFANGGGGGGFGNARRGGWGDGAGGGGFANVGRGGWAMAVVAAALPMLIIPGVMVGGMEEALLTGAAVVVLLIVGNLLTFHSQH
ncbi:hypothetical protein NON20_13005 [Synechocystis sp. B12]|nr:hypothetical protein NON20_13005 [Synechocystis sp. B12]